jgi:hypothetical protein
VQTLAPAATIDTTVIEAKLPRDMVPRMLPTCVVRLAGAAFAIVSTPLLAVAQSPEPVQPNLENTERLLGILPEITQLQKLSSVAAPADRWQLMWLHEQITEHILHAYLEFDATNAQIDTEMTRADELHSYLSDRRDDTVTRDNLLGIIIGGGLSAASSGLQLSSKLGKPASVVGLTGGVASAGFGLMGIHAQSGRTAQFDFESNMLAAFFERPSLPNSVYPSLVWTLLNQPSADDRAGLTRKEKLLRLWLRVKRIDSLDSKEKIDHLTSQPSQGFRLSIDDLEDRSAMLHDVRSTISYLKVDLAAILASLPAVPPLEAISAAVPKTGPPL